MKCNEKNYSISRTINILKNKVYILDEINTKHYSDIGLRFNLNIMPKNFNKDYSKLKFSFDSNKDFKKNLVANLFYEAYGSSFEGSTLFIKYKKNKSLTIKTVIEA